MDSREENPINATPDTTRVVAANYGAMSITIVVLVTRFGIAKLKWQRSIGLDELFLGLALLVAMMESALTEHAVRRGLGTYIRPGNSSKLKWLSEVVYASDLLFLIAMFFAKLAVVRTIYRFASRSALSKGKIMILQILIGVWIAFALPAIAFQCGGSLPWLYIPQRCTSSGALWYPTLVISILLDGWLAIAPWSALPELQVTRKERQTILGLFGSRFFVCILGIAQLALLAPALKNVNQPRAMPNPTVMKQLVMNASLVCAAIPVLCRALACYTPPAVAVIYNTEGRGTVTTPLEEIKVPSSVALPNPKKFDGFVKETEVFSPSLEKPSLGTGKDDFSGRFSLAFDKEIKAVSTEV